MIKIEDSWFGGVDFDAMLGSIREERLSFLKERI
jgi:hypothetical protein